MALWATSANAVTFTFAGIYGGNYSQTYASFTAPADGAYQIDAWGAQGGPFTSPTLGGLGAMVGGRIQLRAGDGVAIFVGTQGRDYIGNTGSGGGGATWVIGPAGELLLAAGGGGGGGYSCCAGGPGQATQSGQDGVGGGFGGGGGAGGTGGSGGGGGWDSGGGAGWLGPGGDALRNFGMNGSGAPGPFDSGWTAGCELDMPPYYVCYNFQSGGFNGGGGAGYGGGGGGGGYSGGGGGGDWNGTAGGGGSYIFDGFQDPIALSGVNSGNGLVTITSVPEPATWAMMLIGFGGIGMVMRRSRRKTAATC